MEPTVAQLEPIQALYDQGLFVRALSAATEALGPPRHWRGTPGRILAGRLAHQLGAPRLGRAMHYLAHREAPNDARALYYHALSLWERRGPLVAWELASAKGELPEETGDEDRSDWFTLHARLAAHFRDFRTADRWLDRAEALTPSRPWVLVERAAVLELEDRYPEALALARRALELQPWFRPAVQAAARVLQLLDEDRAALRLLEDAARHTESAAVVMHLASLQTELGLYPEARAAAERAVELSPLMEEDVCKWIAGWRSDGAYYCADWGRAVELAEQAGSEFHKGVAAKLRETRGEGRRVILPVPFVRQHHMTCAPATLSALGRFWAVPTDHLSLAEEICYDGTPAQSERRWAESHGWLAPEFKVDWETTVALIDRGIPFTLTTVEPGGAHLQAVIGYDALRGTLLIRDPYARHFQEFAAGPALKRWASSGPRGMLMLPADRAAMIDGVALPERAQYDAFYTVQAALERHDRAAASAACERMAEADPSHQLTLWARRAIAAYDADPRGMLEAYERLTTLFPDDKGMLMGKLSCLRALARRQERLALLRAAAQAPDADPLSWEQFARELSDDARQAPAAERLLRRAARARPWQASVYHALAGVLWEGRRFAPALALYRFAACLADKDEALARSYFVASRHFRGAGEALAMFRDRFARFGARSAGPARVLFGALDDLNRDHEALDVLGRALALRPDDGELLLFAADALARRGRLSEADEKLAAARDRSPAAAWRRVAADVARYRGDLRAALALWRETADAEPLAVDAQRRVVHLLAETGGPAEALAYAQDVCDRFPHNYPLQQLRVEWTRAAAPARAEAVLREVIELHAGDAWARRELAELLAAAGRVEEAAAQADEALRLDPSNPASHAYVGLVSARRGDLAAARAAYRRAVTLSVDYGYGIRMLVQSCRTTAQRREALEFVRSELIRQTIFGDGLLAWRAEAVEVLDGPEVLACLREALAARPDLWHAWSAVTHQLREAGRLDEAASNATAAAERFPLLPRLWLDLAQVRRAAGDAAAERGALEKALAINANWGEAVCTLADLHERAGDFTGSEAVLVAAAARMPGDAYVRGALADVRWKLGAREAALEDVARAVAIEPGYEWGWRALARWGAELGRPEAAEKAARALADSRSGEARSWLVLARTLGRDQDLDERLAALDRATALNPQNVEAHDYRAVLLARHRRFDEAAAACRPPAQAWGGESLPIELRARAAWVDAQRGNLPAAIAAMRQVTDENPHFFWARIELCDYYDRAGDLANYLASATDIAALWPLDAKVHGYLGDAKLRTGDRAGGKAALRRALMLAPEYGFASTRLFDLELEDNDPAAARELLAVVRKQVGGLDALVRGVRLACATADPNAARADFRAICDDPASNDWALEEAADALARRQWTALLDAVLGEALAGGADNPAVARVLTLLTARRDRWRAARRLVRRLTPRPAFQVQAAWAYLSVATERKQWDALRWFLLTRRRLLRNDTLLWGTAGWALHSARRYRAAVRWLRDWKDRDGVEAWMLVNLAEAYRALGHDAQGRAVNLHGFSLSAPAQPHGIHALWLAADAVLAGTPQEARQYLAEVDMKAQEKSFHFFRGMIDALLAWHEGSGAAAFKTLAGSVLAAERAYPAFRNDRELLRFYRKALRRASHTAGWRGRIWCWYRAFS